MVEPTRLGAMGCSGSKGVQKAQEPKPSPALAPAPEPAQPILSQQEIVPPEEPTKEVTEPDQPYDDGGETHGDAPKERAVQLAEQSGPPEEVQVEAAPELQPKLYEDQDPPVENKETGYDAEVSGKPPEVIINAPPPDMATQDQPQPEPQPELQVDKLPEVELSGNEIEAPPNKAQLTAGESVNRKVDMLREKFEETSGTVAEAAEQMVAVASASRSFVTKKKTRTLVTTKATVVTTTAEATTAEATAAVIKPKAKVKRKKKLSCSITGDDEPTSP